MALSNTRPSNSASSKKSQLAIINIDNAVPNGLNINGPWTFSPNHIVTPPPFPLPHHIPRLLPFSFLNVPSPFLPFYGLLSCYFDLKHFCLLLRLTWNILQLIFSPKIGQRNLLNACKISYALLKPYTNYNLYNVSIPYAPKTPWTPWLLWSCSPFYSQYLTYCPAHSRKYWYDQIGYCWEFLRQKASANLLLHKNLGL